MAALQKTLTLLTLLAVMGGCALPGSRARSGKAPRVENPPTLRVQNQNWLDMTVYVLRGGNRFRLGTVGSMNATVFRIPSSYLAAGGDLRLLADPIGSTVEYTSPSVQVQPGDRVELTLQNNLRISSIAIR